MSAARAESKFTFKCLSPGYLGLSVFWGTLNAQFLDRLHAQTGGFKSLGTAPICFPQRVPRTGFFEELAQAEIPEFRKALYEIQWELRDKLLDFSVKPRLSENECGEYLNYLDLSARYGLLGFISTLTFENVPATKHHEFYFEKLTYQVSLAASEDLPLPHAELFAFFDSLNESNSTPFFRAVVANRIIVALSRYSREMSETERIEKLAVGLLEFAAGFEPATFAHQVSLSMMWRGLPMAPGIPKDRQKEYLHNSIRGALKLDPCDRTEEIVKKELLLTTRQSLSKFNLACGDFDGAKDQLRQMIELDPLDSTAYSELGLLLYKRGIIEEASEAFSKACVLGPPGLALNLFFKGECEKKLGRYATAVESLRACARLDETAVSPWLSLHEIHHINGEHSEATRVRDRIFENPDLLSQITDDERKMLGA
jgi:tetratricopeptide (TPR) repeat protein